MASKKVTEAGKADTFDPGVIPRGNLGDGPGAAPTGEAPQARRADQTADAPLWRQCLLLAVAALIGLAVAGIAISRAVERERAQMLAAIHGRADSLVWALEGGARLLDRAGLATGTLGRLVAEVARQPGVAWIAITDSTGRILADSNPELAGATLYTPEEMRRLAPGRVTRGRFSPDDPNIYETWRLFAPARLRGMARRHDGAGSDVRCVFVALDVAGMRDALKEYALQLWIVAGLVLVAGLAVAGLGLLFRRYRSSRRLLADAEALAAQVVRNYPAGLVVLDTTGRLRLSNARARAMLGLDAPAPGDAPESPAGAAALAGRGLDWPALMAELEQGTGLVERELELWRPQGAPLPVQLTAARLLDSGGAVTGYLFALRDMGEIRSLQRQLRQHERLSALGNLAAGLAHEIRNPLSSIRGYATYLTERLKDDPLGHATGQILMEETGRLDRVLTDLLSLARPRDLAPAPADLAAVLERVVTVAAPDAAEKSVRLTASLPKGGAEACVDADRLMQAVLNLVINAIQATPAGGEVEVALERDEAEGEGTPGWRIRVRDTGSGMSAATAAQIFTPYFTTKANGTGLGLAIARQVVEQHGGAISASTLPGRGTTMTIRLPGGACLEKPAGGAA